MAKSTGFTCDVCGAFQTTSGVEYAPAEWIKVALPHSNGAKPEDYMKDICTDKCLAKLGRERAQASGSLSGGTQKRNPSGVRSRMDDDLLAFLESKGIRPMQRGGLSRNHTYYQHDRNPVPECPLCEYATISRES